jgi:two-component system sensor histidine kinase RpfC
MIRLRDGFGDRLRAFWTALPEASRSEYVLALNRLGAAAMTFLVVWGTGTPQSLARWGLPMAGFICIALALLLHLRLQPQARVLRRGLAICLDVSGATVVLNAGGEGAAFMYVVYLWIIIGNGARFGGPYLLAATLASLAGFGGTILINGVWRAHGALSVGLVMGMAVLPFYAHMLIRELAVARRQAERADHAKSLFLASVSSELRAPLTSIIGMVELLQATRLTPAQAEMLATIDSAATGQLGLVQDVLEFSRIEAGHARMDLAPFDLLEMLRGVSAVAAVEARRRGLLINTHVTARTPLRLRGDARHLREVLLNLMDNAIKFTPTGSVTLAADGQDIDGGQIRLRLEVMDTGIGIAPEARERIFALFTQANDSILDRFGGTGLGLALCERRMRLMGGSIGVDSVPQAGSTFWVSVDLPVEPDNPAPLPVASLIAASLDEGWVQAMQRRLLPLDRLAPLWAGHPSRRPVTCPRVAFVQEGSWSLKLPEADAFIEVRPERPYELPARVVRERFATSVVQSASIDELRHALVIASRLAAAMAPPPDDARASRRADTARKLAGTRILVADDNSINRLIVGKMLQSHGAIVAFASNGEQALEVMTSAQVDAALLDVNMPVMDGVEAAKLYGLSVLGGRRIPMIALTAAASADVRTRCLEAGMDACLVKPVRMAELMAAIGDAVVPADPSPPADGAAAMLDAQTIQDLKALGGSAFLEQLIGEFDCDGHMAMADMESQYLQRDVQRFRAAAHSMCGIAANIGAVALRDLCRQWEGLSEAALESDGPALLAQLKRVWAETTLAFNRHVSTGENLRRR